MTRLAIDPADEASERLPAAPAEAGRCRECQTAFRAWRWDRAFCSAPCRKAWNRRRADRGTRLYNAAYTWRRDRATGGISAISAMVDGWLREDRARAEALRGGAEPSERFGGSAAA